MADDKDIPTNPSTSEKASPKQRSQRRPYRFNTAARRSFLDALSEGASVTRAAAIAGVSRVTAYNTRHASEAFAAAWEAAVEAGTDILEDEAVRRALKGVDKPVGFYQGVHKGTFVTEYSDSLLMFLLKGRRPEKFKDRTELSVGGDLAARLAAARRRVDGEAADIKKLPPSAGDDASHGHDDGGGDGD